MSSDPFDVPNDDATELEYANGRLPGHTYASKQFPLHRYAHRGDPDVGRPSKFLCRVVDGVDEVEAVYQADGYTFRASPGGRMQIRVLKCVENSLLKEVVLMRINRDKLERVIRLKDEPLDEFLQIIDTARLLDIESSGKVRISDDDLEALSGNQEFMKRLYSQDPALFREIVQSDTSADDLVVTARRRSQLERFEQLLSDETYFDAEATRLGGRREEVWQRFFEENKWIFGYGLAGQLLMAWDPDKLEKVVRGSSMVADGKRADALLRTVALFSSFVFVEIKTHQTKLLGSEYRPGCWAPSKELTGAVAQSHGTVYLACRTSVNI